MPHVGQNNQLQGENLSPIAGDVAAFLRVLVANIPKLRSMELVDSLKVVSESLGGWSDFSYIIRHSRFKHTAPVAATEAIATLPTSTEIRQWKWGFG